MALQIPSFLQAVVPGADPQAGAGLQAAKEETTQVVGSLIGKIREQELVKSIDEEFRKRQTSSPDKYVSYNDVASEVMRTRGDLKMSMAFQQLEQKQLEAEYQMIGELSKTLPSDVWMSMVNNSKVAKKMGLNVTGVRKTVSGVETIETNKGLMTRKTLSDGTVTYEPAETPEGTKLQPYVKPDAPPSTADKYKRLSQIAENVVELTSTAASGDLNATARLLQALSGGKVQVQANPKAINLALDSLANEATALGDVKIAASILKLKTANEEAKPTPTAKSGTGTGPAQALKEEKKRRGYLDAVTTKTPDQKRARLEELRRKKMGGK